MSVINRNIITWVLPATIIVFGFQNCSEVEFSKGDPQSIVKQVAMLPTLGEYASIAFEDSVSSPNAGDRDYNDAVFNYKVTEEYNSLNQLIKILIEVRVREKKSGNNHRLYLYFNGNPTGDFTNISHLSSKAFNGTADIGVILPDGETENYSDVDNIMIVPETSDAVGEVYNLEVVIKNPEQNVVAEIPYFIDFKKYRFILQNHGQNSGIDIAEINSADKMIAYDGYPLGFMIPTDWQPPVEGRLIDNNYPNFGLYRAWLNGDQSTPPSQEALEWFL